MCNLLNFTLISRNSLTKESCKRQVCEIMTTSLIKTIRWWIKETIIICSCSRTHKVHFTDKVCSAASCSVTAIINASNGIL